MGEMSQKTSTPILRYQQRVHREYAQDIKLPKTYTYPDGNPIRPLPPVRTKCGGLMIVGAYPSARFEARPSTSSNRTRLVPVANNLEPFGYECYFDGKQVRTLTSGDGIREFLLTPLKIDFGQCWITDLVKVFLYKDDHQASCADACPNFKVPVLRNDFMKYAVASLPWLKEECDLCKPKLVITLGEEVAQAVTGGPRKMADELLNQPVISPDSLGGWPTLCLPHPDACRRSDKWRQNIIGRIALARKLLSEEQP